VNETTALRSPLPSRLHSAQPPGGATTAAAATPLLVAVHGWLLSGRLWDPLTAELGERHALWCPDLPGFGRRPRPRGLQPNLASYGRWLAQAIGEHEPQRPVVLLGHSLGGSIALHAASHLGERLRGMVQIAAGGGVYQPRTFARVRLGGAVFLRWRPGWLGDMPGLEAIRSPLRADLRAARSLLACSTNRGAVRQLPLLAAQLTVPSLWIVGSQDSVMQPRYVRHLAGYSPRHRVELLQGVGHLPMRQQPRQLAERIEEWLEQEVLASAAVGLR
jgi:2-succinyl-6-hydroxy-2,4-cyclohexadiene-1-carboxylate synthase